MSINFRPSEIYKGSTSLWDISELLQKAGLKDSLIGRIVWDLAHGNNRRFLEKYQGAFSLFAEHLQDTKQQIIITLEWRDTAGKGSNIKKVTHQLDNRVFGVTAFPGIPTPEEKFQDNWFQRYEQFFPQEWSIQFFDRSWYNRAGVEAVMGFSTEKEYERFMSHVNDFEKERIIDAWYDFLKIYLSIGKETQKMRLQERKDVRKRWKSSPVDAEAQAKWGLYTLAKQKILERTDIKHSPRIILDSTQKFLSTVEIIKAVIATREEVKKMVEKDLSIDLSPNKKIRRTGKQELKRMEDAGEIPINREFDFAEAV